MGRYVGLARFSGLSRLGRRGQVVAAVAAAVLVAAAGAAAGVAAGSDTGDGSAWRPPTSSSADPSATTSSREPCGGWDCKLQARFAATSALIASKPGQFGMVVRDRVTGQSWRAGTVTDPVWTASTIKLAIAADLLVRARAGDVTLTRSMRDSVADMLDFSANWSATNLWRAHGGEAALARYRAVFGMTGVHFPATERVWGAVKCTVEDLAALMSYILDKMHPADRAFVVDAMRSVHRVQQWGVWSAGSKLRPGVKDGWNVELNDEGERGWVVNSVGFAGPGERYAVAVMYELEPGTQLKGNTIRDGVSAVSDAVATLFGAKVPAAIPSVSLLLNPPGLTPTPSPTPSLAATTGPAQSTPASPAAASWAEVSGGGSARW